MTAQFSSIKRLNELENNLLLSNLNHNLANWRLMGKKKIFGIPRGGTIVSLLLTALFPRNCQFVETPEQADCLIDDVWETGATEQKWKAKFPDKPMFFLVDKRKEYKDTWIHFPWESEEEYKKAEALLSFKKAAPEPKKDENPSLHVQKLGRVAKIPFRPVAASKHTDWPMHHIKRGDFLKSIEGHCAQLLLALGIDYENDQHTKDTPRRMASLLVNEVMRGRYEPAPEMTTFKYEGTSKTLILVPEITLRSMCSHHFVPIIGTVRISYVPHEKIIGISKFHRYVDWLAARPWTQEELTQELGNHLKEILKPEQLSIVIEAKHMCMVWRGVKEPLSSEGMMTSFAYVV